MLPHHLDQHWDHPELGPLRLAFPDPYRHHRHALEAHIRDLVARDVKAPPLKALQGHLWRNGYQSGRLQAPLFPDVGPFIKAAHEAGKKIIIYSSGSVPAQKLLFAHTTAQPPDLTPFISGWFDTLNAGPKTDPASYSSILSNYPHLGNPARCLFLSDNLNEVEAALAAGISSLPVIRPGNPALPPDNRLSRLAISDFGPEAIKSIQPFLAAAKMEIGADAPSTASQPPA